MSFRLKYCFGVEETSNDLVGRIVRLRSYVNVLLLAVVILLPDAMMDRDEGVFATGQLDQIVVVDAADDLPRELLGLGHEGRGCLMKFLQFLRDHLLVLDDMKRRNESRGSFV